MTKVRFFADEKGLYGFEINGHSSKNCDDEIGKIICAAVSSAAYMAANTVTEIIGDKAAADVSGGAMRFEVTTPCDKTRAVLEGLRLHLGELSAEYGSNIVIIGGAD